MNNAAILSTTVFSKTIKSLGDIQLRFFDLEKDVQTIYDWVTKPYATYWGMQEYTLEEVKIAYQEIVESNHHDAFIGMLDDQPIFLMERYKASKDPISDYYDAKEGDCGMHILVGPAKKKISNFTWYVFSTIIEYLFTDPRTDRIVVEPDVRNDKIHILNKKAGFKYHKEVDLPHKRAAIAFCEKEDYKKALLSINDKSSAI
ncbi:GNAT family N-acetyltransferase [Aquimarina sediminis]|uniref:GNAT family N-acetyltransferase n=1 Tax=Aquimarina sediminis TaxID=2070536 RepID=UPI000FFF2628|nr:GNAT family N-acetyltransferase [Aquimarina sediminis]